MAMVESSTMDYAFEYKSVAVQHGLKYVELPVEINLKDPALGDAYAAVSVNLQERSRERK